MVSERKYDFYTHNMIAHSKPETQVLSTDDNLLSYYENQILYKYHEAYV